MTAISNHPRISVIIPAYNCGKYIDQCLDSVCNQSLHDIQVLLVDDGSTDNSTCIIDQWTVRDSRIRALRQCENRGVSVARNLGLDQAEGEYIVFLDADDYWSDMQMLSELYRQIREDESDLLRFGAQKLGANGEVLFTYVDRLATRIELANRFDWKISYATWAHIIRHDLIKEHHLRFEPGLSMGEDALFNIALYCNARRLSTSTRVCYDYRHNQASANYAQWNEHQLNCTVWWFELAIKTIKQSPAYSRRPDLLQNLCLERLNNFMRRLGRLALVILDKNQLTGFMNRWNNCFAEIDSKEQLTGLQQQFLDVLDKQDVDAFRHFIETESARNARIPLNRQQAIQLGRVLLSQQKEQIVVDLGAGWKLDLPKAEAHELAHRLLECTDEKFILKLWNDF